MTIKSGRWTMGAIARSGLATTVLTAVLTAGSLAQASVVDAKIGTMNLDARAGTLNETTVVFENHEVFDDASFFVTPTDLSVSGAVKSSSTHSTASLAVDARASWTSSDHGMVTLNTLTSLYSDGESAFDGAVSTGGLATYALNASGLFKGTSFWQYNFTPTVDSVITFDVSKAVFGDAGLRGSGGFYILIDKDHVDVAGDRDSDDLIDGAHLSYGLVAGRNYTFGIEPVVQGVIYQGRDSFQTLTSLNVTFDITASGSGGPTGPGGGGAVPEPATWALMILGFGAAGATIRRRRLAA